jgi:hypothetical protein
VSELQPDSESLRQHYAFHRFASGCGLSVRRSVIRIFRKGGLEQLPVSLQLGLRGLRRPATPQLFPQPRDQQFLHNFGWRVAAKHILARDSHFDEGVT